MSRPGHSADRQVLKSTRSILSSDEEEDQHASIVSGRSTLKQQENQTRNTILTAPATPRVEKYKYMPGVSKSRSVVSDAGDSSSEGETHFRAEHRKTSVQGAPDNRKQRSLMNKNEDSIIGHSYTSKLTSASGLHVHASTGITNRWVCALLHALVQTLLFAPFAMIC